MSEEDARRMLLQKIKGVYGMGYSEGAGTSGGDGTKVGAKKNPWIKYLKAYKPKTGTMAEYKRYVAKYKPKAKPKKSMAKSKSKAKSKAKPRKSMTKAKSKAKPRKSMTKAKSKAKSKKVSFAKKKKGKGFSGGELIDYYGGELVDYYGGELIDSMHGGECGCMRCRGSGMDEDDDDMIVGSGQSGGVSKKPKRKRGVSGKSGNPWVHRLKEYAMMHGVSYKQAMQDLAGKKYDHN